MDYKLKTINDEVEYITSAGSDFVKSSMPIGRAKGIIASGKVKVSDKFDGFPIAVNGEYFFPGELAEEKSSDKKEKPADEQKPDDKGDQGKEEQHFKKNKWRK